MVFRLVLGFMAVFPLIILGWTAACKTVQQMDENTPDALLRQGAQSGDPTTIERALLAGADPLRKDERGRTPLHHAANSGNADAVRLLLQPKSALAERRAQNVGVAIIDYLNNTGSPNYNWVGVSLPDAVQGLMAENFSFKRLPVAQSQKQANKIIGKRKTYTKEILSKIGSATKAAVIISGVYSLDADKKQVNVETVVFTATDNRILLESTIKAPLDARLFEALNQVATTIVDRLREYTAADFAIRPKNAEQLLISDVNARDRSGISALSLAAAKNNEEIVSLLIKAGADYQADLTDAINYGDEQVAEAIIRVAPEMNFRRAAGKTPLMQAAFKGRYGVIRALIARKAQLNLRDLYGFSALLYAAQEGHSAIVGELITAGADVNLRTWDNFSALEAARRKGRVEIVEMLGKAGAK